MDFLNSAERSFATGSRETPDICDQYLEKIGYYRKHTARDSANLFRVISEQHYDIQLYHGRVRQDCVDYLREHPSQFPQIPVAERENYLETMASCDTIGSMTELMALALLHRANVQIFEPFTNGRWFYLSADCKETWRIFMGRDKYFDSVFTLDYMKMLAYCQALVYEVLYVHVMKLPDVAYAVERMLYDPYDRKIRYYKNDRKQDVAVTVDGRRLVLSSDADTSCVLSSYRFCHFHNNDNFPSIAKFFRSYRGDGTNVDLFRSDMNELIVPSRTCGPSGKPDPLLYQRNVSCVRQLLSVGITPFPYKTAKLLDPHIYRNAEYDAWMEDVVKGFRYATNREHMYKIGARVIAKIKDTYKSCRIEQIVSERQMMLVRLNASSAEWVPWNDVKISSHSKSSDGGLPSASPQGHGLKINALSTKLRNISSLKIESHSGPTYNIGEQVHSINRVDDTALLQQEQKPNLFQEHHQQQPILQYPQPVWPTPTMAPCEPTMVPNMLTEHVMPIPGTPPFLENVHLLPNYWIGNFPPFHHHHPGAIQGPPPPFPIHPHLAPSAATAIGAAQILEQQHQEQQQQEHQHFAWMVNQMGHFATEGGQQPPPYQTLIAHNANVPSWFGGDHQVCTPDPILATMIPPGINPQHQQQQLQSPGTPLPPAMHALAPMIPPPPPYCQHFFPWMSTGAPGDVTTTTPPTAPTFTWPAPTGMPSIGQEINSSCMMNSDGQRGSAVPYF
uniref:OTU domain-containing protein n=1 Tax=Anopheles albimanus TaxID=7167 RepID=A0A182F0R9_ANOAL